jgi:hypothetical protein
MMIDDDDEKKKNKMSSPHLGGLIHRHDVPDQRPCGAVSDRERPGGGQRQQSRRPVGHGVIIYTGNREEKG